MTNPDNVGGLLPCPFCGGAAQLSDGECGIRGMPMNWRNPRCTRCGCDLGYCHHIEAVERWNRRELCRAAPAGSGEVDYDWDATHEALESMDDYARMDKGVAPYGPYSVLRDLLTKAKGWKEEAALLRKLQQGADENSLRAVAKRNLRSLINIGSDDKALMLKCLEELS